jgi:catechol 2,3-dioxygenase-like lactoylglutathione lyase family enzyme
MTAARPRIERIQHVSLPFPGPEALDDARHFYGAVMGLEERPVPPVLPGAILWYAVGELELHIFEDPSGVAVNSQSRRHPCFQVNDVLAFRRHLENSGVATIEADGEIPGRPRFFARDPFGNVLEFVEFKPDHW